MTGKILDALYPRLCAVCSRPVERAGRYICSECLMRIPFIPTDGCCLVCGREVEGQRVGFLCEDCSGENRPHFDAAACAVRFENDARSLIHEFKYRSAIHLRNDLADWMEAAVRARFDVAAVDVVLPIPATGRHRIDKGYNQCAYLAKELARRIDRLYRMDVLKRTGNPKRQAGLTEEDRRENVKGTFAVRKPEFLRGRTVLLVDDIMTTSATLSECAKTMKESGAAHVWCAALARSIRT